MAVCTSTDLQLQGALAADTQRSYGNRQLLFDQRRGTGQVAVLGPMVTRKKNQYLFYLLVKTRSTYRTRLGDVIRALLDLKENLRILDIEHVTIPMVDPARDGMPWKVFYDVLHLIFKQTGVKFTAYNQLMTTLLH